MIKTLLFLAGISTLAITAAINTLPFSGDTVYAGACATSNELLPGIKPWYNDLCHAGTNEVAIEDPQKDITLLILNVISIVVALSGYAAVGFVIWGGVKYIMAAGDAGKIVSAKKTITNALMGLLIVLAALAVVNFITGIYA